MYAEKELILNKLPAFSEALRRNQPDIPLTQAQSLVRLE